MEQEPSLLRKGSTEIKHDESDFQASEQRLK